MTTSTKAIWAITASLSCAVLGIWFVWYRTAGGFGNTGTIGDTVGGIAGPILNLAGMIVVYLSLREQLRANNDQNIAISNEIKRSNEEVLLKSTEHLIEAASQAIKGAAMSERDVKQAILNFGQNMEPNDISRGLDKHMNNLLSLDHALLTAAALVTLAYNRVADAKFPQEYHAYVVHLFYVTCATQLPIGYGLNGPDVYKEEYTPNFIRLHSIRMASEALHKRIYMNAVTIPLGENGL